MNGFELRWNGGVVDVRVDGGRAHVDVVVPWDGRWLVVRDDVALPRGRDFDVRADGLWLSLVCETPGAHWTIGLEAFALAVDDPSEERGDVVPLGFDLEWEAPGIVHGDVLVGAERRQIEEAASLEVS